MKRRRRPDATPPPTPGLGLTKWTQSRDPLTGGPRLSFWLDGERMGWGVVLDAAVTVGWKMRVKRMAWTTTADADRFPNLAALSGTNTSKTAVMDALAADRLAALTGAAR